MPVIRQQRLMQTRKKRVLNALKTASGADAIQRPKQSRTGGSYARIGDLRAGILLACLPRPIRDLFR